MSFNRPLDPVMKHMIFFLILICSVTTQFAFSDDPMPAIQNSSFTHKQTLEIPFDMHLNQTVFMDELQLKFSDVEDSRCPSDVTCVWEGQAILTFDVGNYTHNESFSFVTGRVTTHYVGSYEITLNGIAPYPTSMRDISEEYVAKLTISENNLEHLPPPLKQINTGIALNNIQCNAGKVLIIKHSGLGGACVYEDSLPKLIQRGWVLAKNEQSGSPFSMLTDEQNASYGPSLTAATEIFDGKKYLVFHGHDWNQLHNVEITIASGDQKITSIRSKTNENGILYMPWPLPDRMPSALYTIHATDGVHQSESTISIPMAVSGGSGYGSSGLEVEVTGEKQVRRGTTHVIEILVSRDKIPVDDARVFISIEDYGEDVIREFHGRTNQQGYFAFSWEIPKKFDDVKTLLAFVDVTDGVSSKTELFKFYVYCLPGEKNCKVKGN